MYVQHFNWDFWNIDHLARHGVSPSEAEFVCRGNSIVVRGREGRYLVYGRTDAGRYLFIVIRIHSRGVIRIITARDMTHSEKLFFQRRN